MKHINININGVDMDYKTASVIARSVAAQCEHEPTVVAWHDAKQHRMSPVIEGADEHSHWQDYGRSHGGDIDVNINGDYTSFSPKVRTMKNWVTALMSL